MIAILPIGCIEHHGPHLPVETDLIIIKHLAEKVKEKLAERLDIKVLPAIEKSPAVATSGWPESKIVSPDKLRKDIVAAAKKSKPDLLFLCSYHWGNTQKAVLTLAAQEVYFKLGIDTYVLNPIDVSELMKTKYIDSDSHAGDKETSIILAINPKFVKEFKHLKPILKEKGIKNIFFAITKKYSTKIDYWGDPACATAETGRKIIEKCVDEWAKTILEVAK